MQDTKLEHPALGLSEKVNKKYNKKQNSIRNININEMVEPGGVLTIC